MIKLEFNLPEKETARDVAALIPSIIIGSILKALFMSVSIVMFVIPTFGTNLTTMMIHAARTTFSITQLITALTGGILACLIWPAIQAATRIIK